MKRIWEGKLRNLQESVELYMQEYPDEKIVECAREMQIGWCGAEKIESRPSDGKREIWVARFHDNSEVLFEWYGDTEEMKASYREMSFNGWGAPASLTEVTNEGGK